MGRDNLCTPLNREQCTNGREETERRVEYSRKAHLEGIGGPVNRIVEELRTAIEETPPELLADIMEQGIVLAGGGALLLGLDRRIAYETKVPVRIADDPMTCVARGAGMILEELDTLHKVLTDMQRRGVMR